MDNNIYEWLNNNSNEPSSNNHSDDTSLIECVLILSINGIIISKDSLIHYCKNKPIINNKEKEDIGYEITSISTSIPSPTTFNGLSIKQFQTIFNNINSLYNSTTTTTTTLSATSVNDTEEYISNKIKFKSSIKIITENNKRILKQKQQHNKSNTIFNSNNNMVSSIPNNNIKYIKSCACNRSMDTLFQLVWRNIIIRNEILFHTRLYNSHYNKEMEFTYDQLSNYKYRNYLDKIALVENDDDDDDDDNDDDEDICSSLIPYGISHITFYYDRILQVNSIPNSVTSIRYSCRVNQKFFKDVLPDSITTLTFNCSFKSGQSISKTWLPKSLLSLSFGRWVQNDIEINELPESLTELNFHKEYKFKITLTSIPLPSIINSSCNYVFDSSNELTNTLIPKSTTYLKIEGDEFNQTIKKGDIPHNVTSIKFNNYTNGLESGSLPEFLKSLDLGFSFPGEIKVNVLPSNLTYVNMGNYSHTLSPNLFPKSITSIKFNTLSYPIPVGYFYSYTNLKSLEIRDYSEIITAQTLPPSLTSLNLGKYGKPLDVNILPTSLLNLGIGELNIEPPGKLPSSIISFTVYVDSPIPVGVLPCNLKELFIDNQDFNQHLSLDSFEQGILPRSLQSIYIRNTNYINSLDPHFFSKYIKLII